MIRVQHSIEIGKSRHYGPENSRLVSLQMEASVETLVNYCTLVLAPASGLEVSPDDDVTVDLGVGDGLSRVFSGKVDSTDLTAEGLKVYAFSAYITLMSARYNMYFEKTSAGDIASALCREAGLEVSTVMPGLLLDYYAVGSNKSAGAHVMELSRLCGYEAFVNENDQLVFSLQISIARHPVQYGANLIDFQLNDTRKAPGNIFVFGESPASFGQGPGAATWLTKRDVQGIPTAPPNSAAPAIQVFEPAIRSVGQANQVANNLRTALQSGKTAQITVLGKPELKVGDTVLLSRIPDAGMDGAFRIKRVTHLLNSKQGFISKIFIASIT